jgi:methyl-accepting chemotaxis protein/methyl-accepting chemotaxis protein-1 (serine sensor receptor)
MAHWNIAKKLFVGVGGLVALLVISVAFSFWAGRAMKAELDHATQVTATQLDLALRTAHAAAVLSAEQRAVLLAGLGQDQNALRTAHDAIAKTRADSVRRLELLQELSETDESRQLVRSIASRLSEWDASNQQVEALVGAGSASEAWDMARTRSAPLLAQLQQNTDRLVELQDRLFTSTVERSNTSYRSILAVTLIVMIASTLVAATVVFSVRKITATLRGATYDLAESAQQVASASTQVAGASQSLSRGATEQSASLEETSASMEEMASMTRMNAENSLQAAAMMAETERQVHDANAALGAMVVSMSAIKDSSDKVSKIIKTIDEIAFQTNILALNAAVEAARAGEAGMGFAVVADEVRTLAQRSAQAAKDTASLIEESISKADDGNQKVTLVTTAIAAITDSAVKAKGLIDEVSVASRQQSQGIDQVSQAIAQMEKVTQANAASAEQSAAASEELSAQAETAMAIVTQLKGLIGGGGRPAPARRPAGPARQGQGVIRMPSASPRHRQTPPSAEEQIPLGDATGTYGSF